MEIKELAKKYKDYVVGLRREFHQMPEPSLQEYKTSKRIQEELDKMGAKYKVVAGTGVVVEIGGKKSGKKVALRADIDGLSVNECTGVDYASKNCGMMHACGHDGHISMLLGAARILKDIEDEINGTVKLYFQPAEEVAAGAKAMIEAEPLKGVVDGCFGIHLWSDIPVGKISVEAGPRMASADVLKIEIKGKGGHGSLPHQAIDSVVAGSALVMNLQPIVSREISPVDSAVVTIGSFHSGTRFNVIANQATLEGTVRTFSKDTQKKVEAAIRRVVKSTCEAYRTEGEVIYNYGTTPVINDERCSAIAEKSVEKLLGKEGLTKFEKITGAEDFCYFMEEVPGALAFVGIRNPEKNADYPHHHEKFNMDEDGLEYGMGLYAQFAVDFLNNY